MLNREKRTYYRMSSDSENSSPDGKGYESERSETENRPNNDNEKKDSVIDNSENQTEFSDNMKLLMELSGELGKS